MAEVPRSRALVGPTVLLLVLLALLLIRYRDGLPSRELPEALPGEVVIAEVAGDAAREGIYRFHGPVTLNRLMETAGGGDREATTLSGPGVVKSGSRVSLRKTPSGGVTVEVTRMDAPALLAHGLPIEVNKATVNDLERLPEIGPVLAGRIVAFRETRSGFESEADLLEVQGMGPRTLERIRDKITFIGPGD